MNRILIAIVMSAFASVAMAQSSAGPSGRKQAHIPSSSDFARKPPQNNAGKAPPKKAPAKKGGPVKKAP